MARCWVGDVGVDVVGADIPAPRTEGDAAPDRAVEAPEPVGSEPVLD